MLVYEYMQNGSLDSCIFGMENQQSIDLVAVLIRFGKSSNAVAPSGSP